MAISTDQKVDYLWKKLGYGRTKTDVASVKDAVNESISSPLFLRGDTVWTQTSLIPATIPGSSTSYVTLYPTSAPVECTVDITASTNRTWKTNIIDWIPPELGSTYLVKVYIHTSGNPGTAASSGTQVFAAGSGNNDEWFFDYQSGVLNFIGTNLPNGVNFTGKSVYISGAVYTGLKGAVSAGAATTFTNLSVSGTTDTQHLRVTGFTTTVNQSITGVATVGSNLAVAGVTTTQHLNVTGFTTVVNQSITGVASVGSNLGIAGVTTTQHLNVTGFTTVVNESVTGVATIGTLAVSGVTTTQHLNVTGFTTVANQSITGVASVGSNLGIAGVTTTQHLRVTGFTTTVNQSITGVATVGSNLAVAGVTTTQHLNVTGFTTVANQSITGVATVGSNLAVAGVTTSQHLNITGFTTVVNQSITGVATVGSNLAVAGVTTSQHLNVVGFTTIVNESVTGVSTIGTLAVSGVTTTRHLNVIGFTTVANQSITGVATVGSNLAVVGVTTTQHLNVTGFTTVVNESVTGVATIATLNSTSATLTNINSTGITTIGVVTAGQVFVSGVTTSAGGFVGNLTGIAASATKLVTPRTFEITGDVVASTISFDGTGNVSLAATIQPNSVGLGTDTTGDYIRDITGTANQITVTGGTGEGSTPIISVPNQFTAPQDVTVTRDLQVNRNLNVNGNITIGGTAATLFTTELKVSDPDIVLGFRTDSLGNDISNDTTANHGGVAIASTEGTPLISLYDVGVGETNPATYKKFMWFKSGTFSGLGTDAWLSNYAIGIGSTQFPNGTRLVAGNVQITQNDLAVVRNINASGIATATTFNGQVNAGVGTITTLSGTTATYTTLNGTTGNINTGIITTLSGTNLNYSGVSTIGTLGVAGVTTTRHLNVTGFTTVVNQSITGVATVGLNLAVAGVTTTQHLNVTGFTTVVNQSITGVATIGTLAVSGVTTTQHLNVVGFTTIVNESVTGVSTIGTLAVSGVTTTRHLNVIGFTTVVNQSITGVATIGSNLAVAGVTTTQHLGVVGVATISVNSSSDALRITQTGSGNALVVEDETSPDATPFVVTSTGFVGIGTTNPLSSLTVSSNQQNFEFTVGNSTFNGGIIEYINRITSTTRPDFNYYLGAGSNGAHKFYTNANERFRISSSGNVGIGTTNPQAVLHLIGGAAQVRWENVAANDARHEYYRAGVRQGYISWDANNVTLASTQSSGVLTFATGGTTEKVRIDENGNIGIGTTSVANGTTSLDIFRPIANVHVRNTSTTGEATLFASDADYFTTFKSTYIVKYGTARTGNVFGSLPNADLGALVFQNTTNAVIYTNGGTPLIFATASAEAMRIDSSQRIGIGTANPTSRLHVIGDGLFSGIVTALSFSGNASSATYATSAGIATNATYATSSGISTYATSAGIATYATSAGIATNATYATSAGIATYATSAGIATNATYATSAGIATYATTAGVSTSVSGGIASVTQLNVSGVSTISVNSSSDALRITQTGSGNALVVEDSANPDATPFVVKSDGKVAIGTITPLNSFVVSNGLDGIEFSPGALSSKNRILNVSRNPTLYIEQETIASAFYFSISSPSDNALTITNTRSVGIGITSPSNKLHVSGNARIDGNTNPYLVLNDGTNTGYFQIASGLLDLNHNGDITFSPGGSQKVRINSTGSVGIGTTNPSGKLVVDGSSSGSNWTNRSNLSSDAFKYDNTGLTVVAITADGSSTNGGVLQLYDRATGDTQVHLDSAPGASSWIIGRNVGIGTTNPQSALSFGPNSVISAATIDGSDNTRLSISGGGDATTTRGGFIDLSGNERSTDAGSVDINSGNVANSYVRIQGRSSTSDIRFWINASEAARFDSNGRLGIGTTNPTSKLHVIGDTRIVGTVTATAFVGDGSGLTNLPGGGGGGTNYWVQTAAGIHTLGNVGVGTTNPDGRLTISAASSIDMLTFKNGATTFARLGYNSSSGTDVLDIRGEGIVRILSGGNNERVRITSTGNVGIGTTNPQAALHSNNPNLTAPSLTFGATAGHIFRSELSELAFGLDSNSPFSYFIQARRSTNVARNIVLNPLGGDIGIGTTNPTSRLHVSGDARIVGTVTATAFVGDGSGLTNLPGGGGSSQWVTTNAGIHTLSNVGIGTTNPTSRLTVSGNALVTGISTLTGSVSFGSSASFINNQHLNLGTGNDLKLYHSGTTGVINNTNGELQIGCDVVRLQSNIFSTPENYLVATKNAQVELYYDNSKEFETTGYGATVFGVLQTQGLFSSGISTISVNSSSDAVRITQLGSGNALVVEDETNPDSTPFVVSGIGSVGIGTTNPGAKLTISENSFADAVRITQTGFGNALVVEDSSNPDSTPFVIDASGFVGVGTITPSSVYKLQVHGGGDSYIQFTNTSEGTGSLKGLVIGYDAGGDRQLINSFNKHLVLNTTNAGNHVVIQPTAARRVGIGTTDVLEKLHVVGNVLVAAGNSTGQHITQKPYELNNGTLSWEGSAGQLFSITNNLTSGSIFSVNDVSGIPSVDVNADGTISLAPYGSSEYVGIGTTVPTSKLTVIGNTLITGILTATNLAATNELQGDAFESYEIDLIGYTGYHLRTEETTITFTATNDTTTDPYLWGTTITLPIEDSDFAEDSTFVPFFDSEVVSIENPFRLMITVNGVLQSAFINNTDYVYQSNFLGSRNGYTIDSDNNIKFTESIPIGSDIVARVLPVSSTATKIKNYPFKPTDIVLGY